MPVCSVIFRWCSATWCRRQVYWLLRLRIFSFFHCLLCWMLVIVRNTKLITTYLTNKRCQISERYVVYRRQLVFRSEFRSQSSKNYPKISLKNIWKIPEKFQSHLIPPTIKFRLEKIDSFKNLQEFWSEFQLENHLCNFTH